MTSFVIGGIKKTSLLDYPNKLSAIIFTQGCNFNCGFCHNPRLIKCQATPFSNQPKYDINSFFNFLENRKGKLDGVVITGGEPTLQKDLKPVIKRIKDMGFLIKLDTNGYKPNVLHDLLNENLLDYIAMDIKAPLDKYSFVTNINIDTKKIKKSINLIIQSGVDYEFRTTFMPYFHTIEDFIKIGELIKNSKQYYLQKFEAQSEINNSQLKYEKNFSDEDITKIINILKTYVIEVNLR